MATLRFNSAKQKCVTDSVNSIRGILDVNEATVKTTTTTDDVDEVKIEHPGFKSVKNITDATVTVYVCFLPEVTVDADWQKLRLLPGYNWETFNYISTTQPSFVEAVGETPAYWDNCTRPAVDTLELGY